MVDPPVEFFQKQHGCLPNVSVWPHVAHVQHLHRGWGLAAGTHGLHRAVEASSARRAACAACARYVSLVQRMSMAGDVDSVRSLLNPMKRTASWCRPVQELKKLPRNLHGACRGARPAATRIVARFQHPGDEETWAPASEIGCSDPWSCSSEISFGTWKTKLQKSSDPAFVCWKTDGLFEEGTYPILPCLQWIHDALLQY